MIDKKQFLASLRHEFAVIKHLAKQVPEGQLDYRPTPGQRTTLELLRYHTGQALVTTIFSITGKWDHYDAIAAATAQVQPADFAKAMDKQFQAIVKQLAPFSDASLKKKKAKTWWGKSCTLGEALVYLVLNAAVAYRMQLFLYAKASGASHLGSSDCWAGKPAKKKAAEA